MAREINYLFQIKCFYEWLERNKLSASAITLWHGLMYLWNQSFWKSGFTPAIPSIIARTGLSKSTVLRARSELKVAGLLRMSESKKDGKTVYKLVSFCEKSDTQYKLNKTIQNKTKKTPLVNNPPMSRKERRELEKLEAEKRAAEERDRLRRESEREAYERTLEACKRYGIDTSDFVSSCTK